MTGWDRARCNHCSDQSTIVCAWMCTLKETSACLFCVYLDSWAADCFQCAAVDRAFSFHLPQIGSKASFSWLSKTDMEADGACREANGRLWRFYHSFFRSRSPHSDCVHISLQRFLLFFHIVWLIKFKKKGLNFHATYGLDLLFNLWLIC